MPRSGVSYQEVVNAIDALSGAGVTPSIRLIRENLGRGSLSTIAEHKRAIEAERAERPSEALPDPIAKGLMKGAQIYWQELVDAAEAEIQAVRTAAEATESQLKADLEASCDEKTLLRDDLGAAKARLAELEKTLAERETSLADLAEARRSTERKLEGLSQRHEDVKAERAELKAALDTRQREVGEARAEHARLGERLEQQAAERAAERAVHAEHIAALETRNRSLAARLEETQTQQHHAEAAAARADERVLARERDHERLRQELVERDGEVRVLTAALGSARGELGALTHVHEERLAERAQHLEDLQSALIDAKTRIREHADREQSLVRELLDERKAASS